jgi:hypothetical protein
MSQLVLQSHPWIASNETSTEIAVDGRGTPRIVLPLSDHNVRLGGYILPHNGFPFFLNGVWRQGFQLPYDSVSGDDEQETVGNLSHTHEVVKQLNLLPRPRRGKAKSNDLPKVKRRDEWLRWQLNRYFELSHATGDMLGLEANCGSFVRRSWNSVRQEWIKEKADDAEISLIVRLAKREDLLHALDLISNHPRRVLERYRDDTPISRIQELDSACIRNYAHRPGRNVLEKAGSRQSLFSVLRRENFDTIENRVTLWVLGWMQFESKAWLGRNEAFKNASERYRSVLRLSSNIQHWIRRDGLCEVSELPQLISEPNYPLQFEPRYQLVWKAYLDILKQEKVFEDAWTWQRVVWGESGRQIFHGFITEYWEEMVPSYPVFRSEGLGGKWLLPFRAPGPFKGPVYLFDAMDVADGGWSELWKTSSAFPDYDRIGGCGCEQVLWSDSHCRGVAVWYALWDPELSSLKQIQENAGRCLMRTVTDYKRWSGLVIVADQSLKEREPQLDEPFSEGGFKCIAVSIPMDAHSCFDDIKAGFELALEIAGDFS